MCQVVQQTAITERHRIGDALRVEVSTVSDQRHRKGGAVRCRDQRTDRRMSLRCSTAPRATCALVMTVGCGVHAIDDGQPLVVRLEERVECGSVIAERCVVDVARGPNVALEKAPHRVVFVPVCTALRVAQVSRIPAAAGVHDDPVGARISTGPRLGRSAQGVDHGGQHTSQPGPASDA